MKNSLLILLLMIGSTGCTNKALYEKFQLDERRRCVKEPAPKYSECVERTNKTYEEYQREREDLLDK